MMTRNRKGCDRWSESGYYRSCCAALLVASSALWPQEVVADSYSASLQYGSPSARSTPPRVRRRTQRSRAACGRPPPRPPRAEEDCCMSWRGHLALTFQLRQSGGAALATPNPPVLAQSEAGTDCGRSRPRRTAAAPRAAPSSERTRAQRARGRDGARSCILPRALSRDLLPIFEQVCAAKAATLGIEELKCPEVRPLRKTRHGGLRVPAVPAP
eukprot:scaffold73529_cov82-Phaeocystis_antarctica.AAC.3